MASSEVSDPAAGLILPSILVNSPSPYRPVVRGSSSKAASSNVLMTTRRGIEDFKRHSGSRAPQGPRGTTRHSASLSRGPRDAQHRINVDMDAAGASSPEKCSAEWAFISRSRCCAVLTVQIPIAGILDADIARSRQRHRWTFSPHGSHHLPLTTSTPTRVQASTQLRGSRRALLSSPWTKSGGQ